MHAAIDGLHIVWLLLYTHTRVGGIVKQLKIAYANARRSSTNIF